MTSNNDVRSIIVLESSFVEITRNISRQQRLNRAGLSYLDKFRALGRAATARKLSLVVRFAVVAGEFLAGLDIPLRVKLRASISDAHKHVRRAGVIHKFKWTPADAAVNGLRVTEFDNDDALRTLGASSRLPHGDR